MSYRELQAHGDMFSCASTDCPVWARCWRAMKPDSGYRQTIAAPVFTVVGCDDFIAIKKEQPQ